MRVNTVILPIVLYNSEVRSLAAKEVHKLQGNIWK
jgi:hypothetical protein